MSNIIDLSLSELVSNIKNKKISSNEATSTFVERSKKSKHLNSYNEETFEIALKKAKEFGEPTSSLETITNEYNMSIFRYYLRRIGRYF